MSLIKLLVEDQPYKQIKKTSVGYISIRCMQNNEITIGDIIYIVPVNNNNNNIKENNNNNSEIPWNYFNSNNNKDINSSSSGGSNCSIMTAWPLQKLSTQHIQLDSIQRENCNVKIGDYVYLFKTPFQSVNTVSNNLLISNIYPKLDCRYLEIQCETISQQQYVQSLQSFGMLETLILSQIIGRYFIPQNSFTIHLSNNIIKFKILKLSINKIENNNSNNNNSNDNDDCDINNLDFNKLSLKEKKDNIDNEFIKSIFRICESTKIKLINSNLQSTLICESTINNNKIDNNKNINLNFESIGGLDLQVKQIRELIDLSFYKLDLLKSFGVKPPKGILLYGPPGTGKTLLARIVATQTNATLFTINGADILDKFYGMTEKTLQKIFKDAAQKSPSIIFIDELDALCPKREDNSSEVEKRIVGSLLTLMDGVVSTSDQNDGGNVNGGDKVIVIGCTNRPDSIDSALRRPGRFDNEIEISIPNQQGREQILNIFLSKIPNQLTSQEIAMIASKTHGFVGADIESLCKEASLKCFNRIKNENQKLFQSINIEKEEKGKEEKGQEENLQNLLSLVKLSMNDMLLALNQVKPSSMREVVVEIPKVFWGDIGGQEHIKQKLKEAIEWPLKYPQSFIRMGIKPPKGILLYGPPGCSKTLLAKALATESGLNFIAVKGPELLSKWVGESERAVRDIFKKARQNSPSILFFDEIDGLAISRSGEGSGAVERVVSQLLTEMDGIQPLTNVTIIGATNRPDIIDKAILRAGRIDRILYISPPDLDARKEIFNIHLKKVPHSLDIDINQLSILTDGYSGAEVTSICREASIAAMKEDINAKEINMSHFISAIGNVKKGITQEMLDFYKNYQENSNLQVL
ncbi:hypothetical protein ACTFIW_006206 [Dictyostelium discoideum]